MGHKAKTGTALSDAYPFHLRAPSHTHTQAILPLDPLLAQARAPTAGPPGHSDPRAGCLQTGSPTYHGLMETAQTSWPDTWALVADYLGSPGGPLHASHHLHPAAAPWAACTISGAQPPAVDRSGEGSWGRIVGEQRPSLVGGRCGVPLSEGKPGLLCRGLLRGEPLLCGAVLQREAVAGRLQSASCERISFKVKGLRGWPQVWLCQPSARHPVSHSEAVPGCP